MNRTLLIVVLFFIVAVVLSGCTGDKKSGENTITDIKGSEKNTYMNINVVQGKK